MPHSSNLSTCFFNNNLVDKITNNFTISEDLIIKVRGYILRLEGRNLFDPNLTGWGSK